MRKKLLLADDSITIQKVVELTFPSDEFEVVTAGNGRLAVDKAMTFLPDVVLCDVIMPQLDGYQVCEALRASPELKNVPILLLNGAFEPYDADRAATVGALGNVSKPFDPPALVARVKEILSAQAETVVESTSPEAATGTGAEAEEGAPEEFDYDDPETHPVSTVEVPMGVREMAARSLSIDAPVFAPAEPEVLTTETEPSDFSETLHGPLDEEIAPAEEVPAAEAEVEPPVTMPMEGMVAAANEAIEATVAPTSEFEAPADLDGGDTEPVEFEASADEPALPGTLPPEATAAGPSPAEKPAGGRELEAEREFEPEELADAAAEAQAPEVTTGEAVAPEMPAVEAAAPEAPAAEPMALTNQLAAPEPMATEDLDPDSPTPTEPDIGLAPPIAGPGEPVVEAAPAEPPEPEPSAPPASAAAAAVPSEDVAVPMDMVQQIAQRVISQVSERVIREIAWDVIPGLAEKLVKAEIDRIRARAESERD